MMPKIKKVAKKAIQKVRSIVEEISEDVNEVLDGEYLPEHDHKWTRGALPGGKYVKTCSCGKVEDIDFETFTQMG